MSETEPLLPSLQTHHEKAYWPQVLGALAVLIIMTLMGLYFALIPYALQLGLDNGDGNYSLESLQITQVKTNTIYFKANVTLLLDQISPISLKTSENKINMKISTNASNQMNILDLGLPVIFISANSDKVTLQWDHKVVLKDLSAITSFISNTLSNTLKKYDILVSYRPKFSIPGIPGSWKLLFRRTFDFIAKSPKFSQDLVKLLDYNVKSRLENGRPRFIVNGNISLVNPWNVSIPVIDALMMASVFYKRRHVLDVWISDFFTMPNAPSTIPFGIETDDWDALQQLISAYSEGEEIFVNAANFKWKTENPHFEWMGGLVVGLDFSFALPDLPQDGILQFCRRESQAKVLYPSKG